MVLSAQHLDTKSKVVQQIEAVVEEAACGACSDGEDEGEDHKYLDK